RRPPGQAAGRRQAVRVRARRPGGKDQVIQTIAGKVRAVGLFAADYFRSQPIVGVLTALTVVLFITFFTMLGTLQPNSPGREVALSQVLTAAKQRQIAQATILDEDARVEVATRAGERLW